MVTANKDDYDYRRVIQETDTPAIYRLSEFIRTIPKRPLNGFRNSNQILFTKDFLRATIRREYLLQKLIQKRYANW